MLARKQESISDEFYLLFRQRSEFLPKIRKKRSTFCAKMEIRIQLATLAKTLCLKIIDFSSLKFLPYMKIRTLLNFMTSL